MGTGAITVAIVFVVVAERLLLVQRRADAHEASGSSAGATAESILDKACAA